jgi:PKHD-type hydroxylase
MINNVDIFENFITPEECGFLLDKCKKELNLSEAKVNVDNSIDAFTKPNRKSSVGWISDLGFLNQRLTNKLRESLNINGMEINGLGDYQFTEYKEGEYFNWHTDSTDVMYKDRFKSVVVQLNDTYKGGILEIKNLKGDVLPIENKIGTLYIFNSRLLHRVTPVVDGVRYSLVNWVSLVKTNSTKQNLL